MKKLVALFLALTLSPLLPTSSLAAVKVGSSCTTIGTTNGTLICMKKGTKSIWQKLDSVSGVQAAIDLALKSNVLPKNLKPTIAKVRTDKSSWLDQECAVDFPDVKVPDCVAGDLSSKRTMVVYGDSHASMWMPALDSIAKKAKMRIVLFAKLACPLVESTIWSYQLNRAFTECTDWQRLVLPKIESLKPEVIVVTDQWKPAVVDGKKSDVDTLALWESDFPKALNRLNGYTKKLVVIGNNPSMQQDPATCASRPKANIALCASGRSQAGNLKFNEIEKSAAQAVGATYIDTVDYACTQYLCPVVVNNIFVYFDQWHFTNTYVAWLTPVLSKAIGLSA